MAGDALRDANFEARSRLSNDPKEAAKRAALVGDKYDVSGYSDKEISMALMGSSFGDEDYARLTGKSIGGDKETSPSPSPAPETPSEEIISEKPKPIIPIPMPGPSRPTPGGYSQTQNITQDNDISTVLSGDNNVVTNNQNNSIGQYGGRNSFLNDWMSKYKLFA